jgi:hypothetical protein
MGATLVFLVFYRNETRPWLAFHNLDVDSRHTNA